MPRRPQPRYLSLNFPRIGTGEPRLPSFRAKYTVTKILDVRRSVWGQDNAIKNLGLLAEVIISFLSVDFADIRPSTKLPEIHPRTEEALTVPQAIVRLRKRATRNFDRFLSMYK